MSGRMSQSGSSLCAPASRAHSWEAPIGASSLLAVANYSTGAAARSRPSRRSMRSSRSPN
ncbi:hypothetical protein ACFPRL_20300 [Pseudoclavibacter helvolus]